MSVHTARKIADATQSFNSSRHMEHILYAYEKLRERTLGETHMNNLSEAITALAESIPIQLFCKHKDNSGEKGISLKKRRLHMQLAYMGSDVNPTPNTQDRLFPSTYTIDATHFGILILSRDLPLMVASQHVEFRHIKRAGEALDYSGPEFLRTAALAIMMSEILQDDLDSEVAKGKKSIPLMIPTSKGMFICDLYPCEETAFAHKIFKIRTNERKRIDVDEDSERHEDWHLRSFVQAETFISPREFSQCQRDLHSHLMLFLEDPHVQEALESYVMGYARGTTNKVIGYKQKQLIDQLKESIKEVTEHTLWKATMTPTVAKPKQYPDRQFPAERRLTA